jgi:hypothetical protein
MSEKTEKISTNALLCFYAIGLVMITFAAMAFALTHRHIHEHPVILCIATACSLMVATVVCIENFLDQKMNIDAKEMSDIISESIMIEGSFNKY